MSNEEKLARLEAIFESLHRQPPLSDQVPDGSRFVWVYGDEVARIKVIQG
jgi:hypothetical protein